MKDPFACDDPAVLSRSAPTDRAAARRAVAARAATPAEFEVLLDMLGLLPCDEHFGTPQQGSERSDE
ncbi:hypothetical protein [Streptomyces sp. NPDC002467]|uniref:hypothetical protein n=1 Tax=Streptomyces sp. NPDC002467 TaxID=3364647 RepID=UPI0036AF6F81